MFVSSNGTGLGHLTRSMAIARRLDRGTESLFVTLSRAAPVVREMGFPVEYMASHGSPGAGSDFRWSRRLAARLRAAIAEARPRTSSSSTASFPYDPLLAAMKRVPATVWCRRGPVAAGREHGAADPERPLRRDPRAGRVRGRPDAGPTSSRRDEAHEVAPIVFLDDAELLPRAEAERELGLEPGKPTILVQLGQGPEVADATARCLRALAGARGRAGRRRVLRDRGPARRPRGRRPPALDLSDEPLLRGLRRRRVGGGYNAFHELVRFGVPALFVPMRRETDDQGARARYAASVGVALAVDGPRTNASRTASASSSTRTAAGRWGSGSRSCARTTAPPRPPGGSRHSLRTAERRIGHA